MNKKLQILLFYLVLVIVFALLAWKVSKNEDQMGNSIGAMVLAVGLSALLWQNIGRKTV